MTDVPLEVSVLQSLDAIPEKVTMSMFLASQILILYLVYSVLTKGIASDKTFEEGYWYEDREKLTVGDGRD